MISEQTHMFDLPEAERRRDEAIERVQNRGGDRKSWVTLARRIAVNIAKEQGTVDADRLLFRCPLPDDVEPRLVGAVFRNHPELEPFTWSRSARKQGHGRPMRVWRLKQ